MGSPHTLHLFTRRFLPTTALLKVAEHPLEQNLGLVVSFPHVRHFLVVIILGLFLLVKDEEQLREQNFELAVSFPQLVQ
jgi:hypothetical protein